MRGNSTELLAMALEGLQTGVASMRTFLDKLSQMYLHVVVRLDSDTRVMEGRILSGSMVMEIRTPSTSDPAKMSTNFYLSFPTTSHSELVGGDDTEPAQMRLGLDG